MKDRDPAMTTYLSEGRRYERLADGALADVFLDALGDAREVDDLGIVVTLSDTIAEFDLRGVLPPWGAAAPIMREIAERQARTMTPEQKDRARKRPFGLPERDHRRLQ